MKKLHKLQIISKLVVITPLTTIALLMRNFIANFVRILGICKDFAGNRVNELGNVPRCGVVPKFSDLEVVRVVARRNLDAAGAEFHINVLVAEDRDFAVHNRQNAGLADEVLVALIVRIDGNAGIAKCR